MGELFAQLCPTKFIFIELEGKMQIIFMVTYKNVRKQKHNGNN